MSEDKEKKGRKSITKHLPRAPHFFSMGTRGSSSQTSQDDLDLELAKNKGTKNKNNARLSLTNTNPESSPTLAGNKSESSPSLILGLPGIGRRKSDAQAMMRDRTVSESGPPPNLSQQSKDPSDTKSLLNEEINSLDKEIKKQEKLLQNNPAEGPLRHAAQKKVEEHTIRKSELQKIINDLPQADSTQPSATDANTNKNEDEAKDGAEATSPTSTEATTVRSRSSSAGSGEGQTLPSPRGNIPIPAKALPEIPVVQAEAEHSQEPPIINVEAQKTPEDTIATQDNVVHSPPNTNGSQTPPIIATTPPATSASQQPPLTLLQQLATMSTSNTSLSPRTVSQQPPSLSSSGSALPGASASQGRLGVAATLLQERQRSLVNPSMSPDVRKTPIPGKSASDSAANPMKSIPVPKNLGNPMLFHHYYTQFDPSSSFSTSSLFLSFQNPFFLFKDKDGKFFTLTSENQQKYIFDSLALPANSYPAPASNPSCYIGFLRFPSRFITSGTMIGSMGRRSYYVQTRRVVYTCKDKKVHEISCITRGPHLKRGAVPVWLAGEIDKWKYVNISDEIEKTKKDAKPDEYRPDGEVIGYFTPEETEDLGGNANIMFKNKEGQVIVLSRKLRAPLPADGVGEENVGVKPEDAEESKWTSVDLSEVRTWKPAAQNSEQEEEEDSDGEEEELSAEESKRRLMGLHKYDSVRVLQKKFERKWNAIEEASKTNEVEKQKIKSVCNIHKFVRRWSAKRLLKQLRIGREMLMTEKNYVDGLRILIEFYLEPLKNGRVITDAELNDIFSNIEGLYQRQKEFYQLMERQVKDYEVFQKEGVANMFIHNTGFMLADYSKYINNFDNAAGTVNSLRKTKPEFVKLINAAESKPEVNYQDLSSFLILPVQRIPRYVMLLKDLERRCGAKTNKGKEVAEALKVVSGITTEVNERKRNKEKVDELENKMKRSGVTHGLTFGVENRRFIKEGKVMVRYGMRQKKTKDRHLVLFSDAFIVNKIAEEDKKANTKSGDWIIHQVEHINDTVKCKIEDSNPLEWSFICSNAANSFKVQTLTFLSTNPGDPEEWVHVIQDLVNQTIKNERERNVAALAAPKPSLIVKPAAGINLQASPALGLAATKIAQMHASTGGTTEEGHGLFGIRPHLFSHSSSANSAGKCNGCSKGLSGHHFACTTCQQYNSSNKYLLCSGCHGQWKRGKLSGGHPISHVFKEV